MNKIDTEKKLELIRTIRSQNQYDRQLFRMREGLLYSDTPALRRGELYGLETHGSDMSPLKNKSFGSFRLRFALAIVFLFAFILCDINHLSIGTENTDTVLTYLTNNTDLLQILNLIK